jgi:starch phosphorylase
VTLYLLDTDLPQNQAWDRELSSRSFGDDVESRVRQSVLLGAGAVRALELLGVDPAMWHVADGPAAVVGIELLSRIVETGVSFDEALRRVLPSVLFSTREALPPSRDNLSFAAVDRHLASVWPALAPHRDSLLALGRYETDRGGSFNVSVLGARASAMMNVPDSAAAGGAAIGWQELRGEDEETESVRGIAEGVHLSTWISADLSRVFDQYVGEDWRERQDDVAAWEAIRQVPDAEIWAVRQRLRGYLVDFIRERARRGWAREQVSGNRLVALGTLLDADALTIGFARPFSAVARPELLLQDAERLSRIMTAARRPVQLVVAGKVPPGDERGKHHLQRVFRSALDPMFGGRVAFVEDYDLHVARLLVQGCDVWLSTPAEGAPPSTSGIKAAVNGVPHLSTADGWWAQGCTGDNGWMIDGGRAGDGVAQDVADARVLYRLLEEQIVPMFYERDRAGVPVRWTAVSKAAIVTTLPRFCARRAVKAFADAAYLKAMASV